MITINKNILISNQQAQTFNSCNNEQFLTLNDNKSILVTSIEKQQTTKFSLLVIFKEFN